MQKKPEFNFIELCLNGFKQKFPILVEADLKLLATWLYSCVSAFSSRDGRSLAGGAELDILVLISVASGIPIDIPDWESPRLIKDKLKARLRCALLCNDHATILSVARGFERNASMAVVDHRSIEWANPYRIVEEIDVEIDIHESVVEWVEVLCEPSTRRQTVGNYYRKRVRRKPIELDIKSLFEGVA